MIRNICYLTPNNYEHKAGDGTVTRKRNIAYIHPSITAHPGQNITYILVKIWKNK